MVWERDQSCKAQPWSGNETARGVCTLHTSSSLGNSSSCVKPEATMALTRVILRVHATYIDFFYRCAIMSSAKTNPTQKRKLWSEESMIAAMKYVEDGKGLRVASRLYNVPVETLRRRVTGAVQVGCRPGPATVLTEEEEDRLSHYLMEMAEMGFGLTREDVARLAFNIVV